MRQFDYVIVGAGSSGCVLANRLSADPGVSVALIEAGPDDHLALIDMPRGFGKTLSDPKLTWVYAANRAGGANEPEYWLRGKVLGGSSSVNGMVYVRGQPDDYDEWENAGCTGWGWSDLLRCFVAMEDHQLGPSDMRGAGGPLKISLHPDQTPFLKAVLAAAGEAGFPVVEDLNSAIGPAMGFQPRTIWKGKRQSAARAFLDPVRQRANLTILTGVEVERLVFDGQRVIGVQVRDQAGEQTIGAGREVIVSAGAINSPKLLQLSGIGPASHLQSLGIKVVADSPDVGANMREHRLVRTQWRLRSGSQNRRFSGLGLVSSALQYFLLSNGPLSAAAFEVGGYITSHPDLTRPDAQLGIGPISLDPASATMKMEDLPGAMCGGYVMRPESRGSVMITVNDPAAPLAIEPNYLSADYDRQVSVGLFHAMRRLFTRPALAPYVINETMPGPGCTSDDEIISAFLTIGAAGYHAAGTCRMGADERSVVAPDLKVRGVAGLRVCDISVMPSLVSGNTNAPAMAMAWRAAEIIASARL